MSKCGTFTQWNITQLLKIRTLGNLKANGQNEKITILNEVTQTEKDKPCMRCRVPK